MAELLQINDHSGVPVGIDLGTTNSLVAYVAQENAFPHKKVQCIPVDNQGNRLLPSIVNYSKTGKVVVGKEAKELGKIFPQDTLVSVKRYMGMSSADLQSTPLDNYEISWGKVPRFKVGSREVTAVEVSAEILRALRAHAENALAQSIEQAVITVPAYFDDAQRQATKDAGRLAGLEVLRILNEPTAAALAYGLDKKVQGYYAVYDLGGGTFDISILSLEQGIFQVMSTKGDTALGGDDFDRALMIYALEKILKRKVNWAQDIGKFQNSMLFAARIAREKLTNETVAWWEWGSYKIEIQREEFQSLSEVQELVSKTLRIAHGALQDAQISAAKLDGVVLVGGMTRTPLIRREIERFFDQVPLSDIDPDEVVARGAAMQANLLAGSEPDEVLLLDVTPLSLGLETMGGVVEKIILRNSSIPASASQVFTTFQDGQSAMDIHVLQGERELVEDCRSLGRFRLSNIPPLAAGLARIQVTFAIDTNGILQVSAQELSTGIKQSITVRPSHGLDEAEIEKMLWESIDHAEEDVYQRLLRDARLDAQRILQEAQKRVDDHAFLLLENEGDQIRLAMQSLKQALSGKEYKLIFYLKESLIMVSNSFAQRVMDYQVDKAIKGRTTKELEEQVGNGNSILVERK